MNSQDRLYFEEVTLNNDKGFVFDEDNPTSVLSQARYESYFTTVLTETWEGYEKDKQFGEDYLWDFFFNIRIYFDKDHSKFKLKYMKGQELAAHIGGIMSIILNFGNLLTYFFNEYYQNIALINEYFEFSNTNYDTFKHVKTNQNNEIEVKTT